VGAAVRVPVVINFIISRRVQMDSGVHRDCFKGVKRNELKTDNSLPSRAEAESELSHSSVI